jgi:hypothetical protein
LSAGAKAESGGRHRRDPVTVDAGRNPYACGGKQCEEDDAGDPRRAHAALVHCAVGAQLQIEPPCIVSIATLTSRRGAQTDSAAQRTIPCRTSAGQLSK